MNISKAEISDLKNAETKFSVDAVQTDAAQEQKETEENYKPNDIRKRSQRWHDSSARNLSCWAWIR